VREAIQRRDIGFTKERALTSSLTLSKLPLNPTATQFAWIFVVFIATKNSKHYLGQMK
jgi:hypothetical protein